MVQSFRHIFVLPVAVDDVYLHRVPDVVEGVFGALVVRVAPVKVKSFEDVFVLQSSSEDVRGELRVGAFLAQFRDAY